MITLKPRTGLEAGLTLSVMTGAANPTEAGAAFEKAIQAAVSSIDLNTLHPVAPGDAGPAFQPKALLASIIHCYARQIYGSADIEVWLASNPDTRPFGLTTWPDAQLIREFRRENRKPIQLCLMTALWLLGQQKVTAGTVTHLNTSNLAEEASRRLIMALFTDSMELGAG
jgi:transposase